MRHGARESVLAYATAKEKQAMKANHPNAIKFMEEFLEQLKGLKYDRVLEPGCGNGIVTKDLLLKRFKLVDIFDPAEDAY